MENIPQIISQIRKCGQRALDCRLGWPRSAGVAQRPRGTLPTPLEKMSADPARRAGAILLAVVLLVLVCHVWTAAAPAPWLRATVGGALLLAALRPRDALLVLAGLGPLIGIFGAARGAPLPARDALVLACFTGWAIRLVLRRQSTRVLPSDLGVPVIAVAVVVVASAVVELWGQRELLGPSEFAARVRRTIEFGLLQDRAAIKGLNAALVHLEGLAIFAVAVRASCERPQFALRVAAMAAAGAAGAAALNVLRIVNVAVASATPLQRVRELLATIRVNVHFSDVNAAGSYFAMMFFPAAAGSLCAQAWLRAVWALAGALIFAAAWLTGSRAAVAAILVVVITTLAARLRRDWRSVRLWGAVSVCAVVALLFVAMFPNKLFGPAVSTAVEIRLALAHITFQMLANEPLLGVGVGAYYEDSARWLLASPLASVYVRENAHNNALQVLAELGVTGLVMFVWLFWQAARRIHATTRYAGDVMYSGIVAGVIALGLTALAGHPLLTPEVSHAFWLMLGTAAGYDQTRAAPSRRTRYGLVLFIAIMIALLPWRFRTEVASLDLEHVRYGTSEWISDAGGRYQRFDRQATLFVAKNVAAVRIPIREPAAAPGALLDVRFDGRVVNRLGTSPEWRQVYIVTPATFGDRNFRRIDLIVNTVPGMTREVHVGQLELVHK